MEETKKEDPVSVENAAQEDQITEVPADETVGQNEVEAVRADTAEQESDADGVCTTGSGSAAG